MAERELQDAVKAWPGSSQSPGMTAPVRTEKRKTSLEVTRPAGSLREAHSPLGTSVSGHTVVLRGAYFFISLFYPHIVYTANNAYSLFIYSFIHLSIKSILSTSPGSGTILMLCVQW